MKLKDIITTILIVGLGLLLVLHTHKALAYMSVEHDRGTKSYVLFGSVLLDNSVYNELILALREAKEGDTVNVVIRKNNGGAVPTMDIITRAMNTSKAKVVVTVEGHAYSAGAVLAFQGDVTRIQPGTKFIFHTGSICFGPGLGCMRVTPDFRYYGKDFTEIYDSSIEGNRFIYTHDYIRLPGGVMVKNPFQRNYVDKNYWEFMTTGFDKVIMGYDICKNKKSALSCIVDDLSEGHYVVEGVK